MHRIVSRWFYRPTFGDRAGLGDAAFTPWRDGRNDLVGYVREQTTAPDRVVVFFHGKDGEALREGAWFARLVPPRSVLVLAEYPGYGARGGVPTEPSLLEAASRLVAAATERWTVPLTVAGESLGSSVACFAAAHGRVDRVALVSPFSSLAEVLAHRFPWLPRRVRPNDLFTTAAYAAAMKVPLHIAHGEADRIVPVAVSRRLYASYGGATKRFTEIPGAGHVTIRRALLDAPEAAEFRRFVAAL